MEVTSFCWSSLQESSLKKKTIHKLCALFVPSSCFKGGGHPYRNDGRPLSTRSGTQSTYCIRWKVWGCLISEGRGVTVLSKIFLGRKPRLITYFLRDYLTKVPQPQHFQSWDCYQRHKRKFLMSFIRFFLRVMVSWVWLIIAPLCFLAECPTWSLFNKSSEVEALTVLAAVLRCACKRRTIVWIRNFQ